ncbi:cadherin-86C-like [Uloborus diversus]|uniref:cadherin-86C-like n=1 Tax=Uloborus diversus TaxID=327109 RepID=UPI0024091F7E|nr:cadherin-86C-like [Uloborus diversus]
MILSLCLILMAFVTAATGVAPTIDLSHNMRILKLPIDTKVGSVIYRLRGSDPDNNVLTFGVRGEVGNKLLDIRSVTETRANVFLRSVPTERAYKLTIYVTDGIQTTEVETSIIITNATNQKSPFLEFPPLITVSELTQEKEVIGDLVVRKRNSSSLPVLFEVEGSDKFAIRYVISPLKEATKAEIFLVQMLDYEKQNLFTLTVYALNPWTDEDVDTRNVAMLTILVAVRDAQDTPPVFHPLPPVIQVSDSLHLGDYVTQIIAEDGDFGNQRNVTYSFVPGSQGITYFNMHSRTGVITLASSIELLREAFQTAGPFVLSVQATEVESELIPGLPASSEATMAVVLVNTENRPPRFTSRRYVATIEENSPILTAVIWEGPEVPKVFDDDQGKNGSFELVLDGDGGTFSVQPSRGRNELMFSLLVKNFTLLDYETSDTKYLEFRVIAQETASVRPLSATAEIRVKLTDANDNIPQFSSEVYNVTLPEDAPPGTVLTKIQATDEDTGSYGVVRYTAVNGPIAGNLRLDPVSGELSLLSGEGLDRERIPEYQLTVEARDDQGKGNRNTVEVRVVLSDANDNAPVFLQPRYDAVLNPDMRSFYETLRVQAYDADGPGPNSEITYEIVNGNYQEKFRIDPRSGELGLTASLLPNPDMLDPGLPVITLTVRAHDQGVPVKFSTVKVQVHYQEYLNRSISFIIPLSAKQASERKPDLERGFSTLTGAHVNVHSVHPHNASNEKSIIRCWVSYPLSSTVDLSNVENIIGNLLGQNYYLSSTRIEAINRSSFDIVFWLLIALVILMILAIIALFLYCCCVKTAEGRDMLELKNKVAPEENIIHYKEEGAVNLSTESRKRADSRARASWQEGQATTLKKSHVRSDEERPSPRHRAQQATTTSYAQSIDESPARRGFYPDGGIPAVAGERGGMERAYRRGRPLSPGTDRMVREMAGEAEARRLGNYVVVRKVVRPRLRVDAASTAEGEDSEDGPRRTEILYIRSPMREDEEERPYVRDGEILRSVSETALNADDPHLRVPPASYRHREPGPEPPPHEASPSTQQLKFSRYHRTEGDVIVAADDPAEMERHFHPHGPPWVPFNQQGEYARTGRMPLERWDGPEFNAPDYRRYPQDAPHGFAGMQRGPHPNMQPHPMYPYPDQFAHTHHHPEHHRHHHHQLAEPYRTQGPHPDMYRHRVPEHAQRHIQRQQTVEQASTEAQPPEPGDGDEPNDDSRTVVISPAPPPEDPPEEPPSEEGGDAPESPTDPAEEEKEPEAEEQAEKEEEAAAEEENGNGEAPEEPPPEEAGEAAEECPAQRRMSRLHPLSTEDSEATRLDDTDAVDSRENHEDSDRLGLRTTEDENSRPEDHLLLHTDGEDEDSDSGIGKDGTALRLKKSNLMEKKSLFTIAYDGMQTRGLKSAGERDDSP